MTISISSISKIEQWKKEKKNHRKKRKDGCKQLFGMVSTKTRRCKVTLEATLIKKRAL